MAANNGKLLEAMLTKTNESYLIQGRAMIIKQHPEVKTMRDHRQRIKETIYAERSGLDYAGTVPGGRFLTFEAKQVKEKNRLPFDMIKPHQVETMARATRMGAHAFLIVFFVQLDVAFLLRPESIVERHRAYTLNKAMGKKTKPGEGSLSFEQIKAEGFPIIEGRGVFLDWIGAYEAAFKTDGP